jgi:hypothetical protein
MLVEGTVYTVTWNGVKYTCLARNDGYDAIYIGNQALIGGDFPEVIESSEPFFILTYAPENWSEITVANIGTYTIKISSQGEEIIHKIDAKYLPEIRTIYNLVDGKAEGSVRTIGTYDEIGKYAFAEGGDTTASGDASHAEGGATTASGECSHAEGVETIASGDYSHAEGGGTTASGECSHVQGRFNIEDTENKYAHIVGNGNYNALSNAHTLDWEGNAWF